VAAGMSDAWEGIIFRIEGDDAPAAAMGILNL
jgi:hypothetical protein